MGTATERRATRLKNRRLAAQLVAINTLHSELNGRCIHCDVPAPCPTRTVARAARRLACGDDGERLDVNTAAETAVARYLENTQYDKAVIAEILSEGSGR
ncbi:hypothetical protein M1M07_07550 [Rhodococcus sp. HM1]|uniref:hypothetical protein n=1 Tax=Rhodococcus sp. HM1 TaxID=2937759 RepID=UPI00200B50AC|nr:hypothetical protein [Rhodococcus sp. HM1]MCK8670971.1 hypothetical protein [Rhodococcus sp. HM1]